MILTVTKEVIPKLATVISVLMKVCTIPCHDRHYITVMLVLQSCSDPLNILRDSSSDTDATSSDCTYHVGNVKVEKDLDVEEEEGEVNVRTGEDIVSEEEEWIGIYSEEEEEDIDTKEEDGVGIKEEVSLEDTV